MSTRRERSADMPTAPDSAKPEGFPLLGQTPRASISRQPGPRRHMPTKTPTPDRLNKMLGASMPLVNSTLLPLTLVAAFPFFTFAAEPKPKAEPPATFLQTDIPSRRRILDSEVTADFRAATIREVIDSIARQGRANIVLALDVSHPKKPQTITRRFDRVPLRTVLYQVSQDTGLGIGWVYENGFPRAISMEQR
jgi:hypothetical protein